MAKDYTELAKEVVSAVGGRENIISVSNCMTRLRFILKDDSLPNEITVKEINGVAGVINQGGQYQVIIGTHVTNVLPFVHKEIDIIGDNLKKVDKEKAESIRVVKKDSAWNKFFKTIQGCLMPLIGSMCGVGILKGLLTILTSCGVLSSTDGTYILLYNAADAFMVFLPIFIAYSAAKVFKTSPVLMMTIAASLVSPTLLSYVGAEETLNFLGITIEMVNYQNTFFPAMVACLLGANIEKLFKKIIPEMIQLMFVPMCTILVTVPITFLVIGPVVTVISNWIANAVVSLVSVSPVLTGIVADAFWQAIVLTGLHTAMVPIIINNIFTLGSCPLNSILTMTVFAVSGVALGYGLKVKDKQRKSMALGNVIAGLCGVTEPIIYTIALPKIKEFVCAFIGGGVAGGIIGFAGIKYYNMVGNGVFALPGMIAPTGVDSKFYLAIVCAVVAFIVSAACAYVVTNKED